MSKLSWIDQLDRAETEEWLRLVAEQSDRLRLELLEKQEQYQQLTYHRNRLRREAGEIP